MPFKNHGREASGEVRSVWLIAAVFPFFDWSCGAVMILLISVGSAAPAPAPWHAGVQAFWDAAFPSFSERWGSQVLGMAMLVFGSLELARK